MLFSISIDIYSKDKIITAIRVTNSPDIDGIFSSDEWGEALPVSDFIQKDPIEGAETSGKATLYFLYDDEYLYIAAKMIHDEPEAILSTMSRRDNSSNSERIIISIDSYSDKRTAYTFGVTASGVRFEYYHATDSEFNRDYTFNPVWSAESAFDSTGWTAEMKIPFSQLRFNESEHQEWGININWWVPHLREDNYWVLVPKKETGWSSRMGKLIGIKGIKPSRRLELLPYISANYSNYPTDNSGNPFFEQNKLGYNAGLDVKMGIGTNFTLDATINPDFGQVEADPATVNLTAYETIYEEKRPFFTEGREFLEGLGPSYFYSRRIGASPRGELSSDFTDASDYARILGAMKFTGRTESGLTVGAVTSLTNKEIARTFNAENSPAEGEQIVEPLTSYSIGRIQQEFGSNSSVAGLMFTGTFRDLPDEKLYEQFNKSAVTGGGDFNLRFNNGEYQITGFFGASYVAGDSSKMIKLQRNSAHYFQRPDASYLKVDSSAKYLTGTAAEIEFGKYGGDFLWEMKAAYESPGFELNDIGVLQSADDIKFEGNITYRETEPGKLFHSWNISLNGETRYNFGGINLINEFYLSSNWTFLNRSGAYFNYWNVLKGLSDDITRGGPLMEIPFRQGIEFGYHSDWTANNQWNADFGAKSDTEGGWGCYFMAGLAFKFSGNLEFSIKPVLDNYFETRQYIKTEQNGPKETYYNRYIFAKVRSNTLSAEIRINYAFYNDLTIEFYAEPFAAARIFTDYGELKAAKSSEILIYGTENTEILKNNDGNYTINDAEHTFNIRNHDLNYISFRSNLVLRWEWLPGSTLYFVWQQNRAKFSRFDRLIGTNEFFDSFTQDGINSLALKISYWINAN